MRIPNISHSLIDYEINPKAFINAHNFPTFKDLVDEIKRIDNDSYAFESMLREPIFLNNFNPHEFYATKIAAFLNRIVSQGAIQAKRRGESSRLKTYSEFSDVKFMHYCIKHKKLISGIQDVFKSYRNFVCLIRRK